MKKVLFLLLLITTSAFAQVEHGLLVGAGVGFPLQDGWKETTWGDKSNLDYRNDYKLNSMIGYRFRFLPEQKFFYDLDMTKKWKLSSLLVIFLTKVWKVVHIYSKVVLRRLMNLSCLSP